MPVPDAVNFRKTNPERPPAKRLPAFLESRGMAPPYRNLPNFNRYLWKISMNEFSILCRVLGSLFYRQPRSFTGSAVTLIREGKLAANWPLSSIYYVGAFTEKLRYHADFH